MRVLNETGIRPNAYSRGGFHSVHIGDLYSNCYLVKRKLGYGVSSTVWLVLHVHRKKYFAMKVMSAEFDGVYGPILEDEVLHCLRAGEHPGKEFTSQLVDRFGTRGPNGIHICLVFAVMGGTLGNFADRSWERTKQGPPARLVKRILKQLLLALDYSHKLGIVHTGVYLYKLTLEYADNKR